jgi:hypothetical protein
MKNDKSGVLDWRTNNFVMVTKSVIADEQHFAKPVDKLVYAVLCYYADNHSRDSYPAIKTIAKKSCCSENTVRTALKRLKEIGLIDVKGRANSEGRQMSNVYILLNPSDEFTTVQNDVGGGSNFSEGYPTTD